MTNDSEVRPVTRTAATGQPIIAGFFPDPSICRHNDEYVLVHSSFEYAPGIPVWTSRDLVGWAHVANALDRPEQLRLQPMRYWLTGTEMRADAGGLPVGSANTGNFAPTIRSHGGLLWLAVTNVSDFLGGPLIFSSRSPAGPWSDPVQVAGLPGIDPDIFWDEDDVAHITVSSYAHGGPHVMSATVDLETGDLLSAPVQLWDGTGGQAPESPHLFRRGEWLYLLLAEGGTERGHAITIARAASLDGPWEPAPLNPILTHRGLDRPVLNVGHGDLIDVGGDEAALVYLGVRPRGFSGFHVNGRETFLAKVKWVDGWPVVDEAGFEIPEVDHSFTDTFSHVSLDARWVAPGRMPQTFATLERPGVRLTAPAGADAHCFLATRPRDDYWTAEIDVTACDGSVALTLRVDERHGLEVIWDGASAESRLIVGDLERRREFPPEDSSGAVTLYIDVTRSDAPPMQQGPDVIAVGVIVDGERRELDRVDGRYISVEVAGGWTGRVVGPRILEGSAVVREFRYVGHPTEANAALPRNADAVSIG